MNKKATWGGARSGAGRPPQTFTLRKDSTVTVWLSGSFTPKQATVSIDGKKHDAKLVLMLEDGDRIIIKQTGTD